MSLIKLIKCNLLKYIECTSEQHNTILESTVNHYVDDSCITLPYSYLLDNNPKVLISSLEKIFERTFTRIEYEFIINSYNKYYSAQDKVLLNNPIAFYQNVKESAYSMIKKE